jgi:predicted glutamine amidotransferase
MCRMLAYSGSGALLRELYDALVKVASADPLNGYKAHDDGWGLLSLTPRSLLHYASASPIFSEGPPALPSGPQLTMIHARMASARSIDLARAHPFVIRGQRSIVALAHNGSASPEVVLRVARRHGLELRLNLRASDTERMAHLLAGACDLTSRGGVEACYAELMEACKTSTSLDSLILSVDLEGMEAVMWAVQAICNRDREEYYRLHVAEGDGFKAAASSSVALVTGGLGWRPLSRGDFGVEEVGRLRLDILR